MSSTGRSCERRDLDFYPTERRLAGALVDLFVFPDRDPRSIRVLEPSAGDGSGFIASLLDRGVTQIQACEISPERAQALRENYPTVTTSEGDFMSYRPADPVDLILGNPPFIHAQEHVERALSLVRTGGIVAMFLRVGFRATKKRIAFIRDNTPAIVFEMAERPCFSGNGGNDSCEYSLFVWIKGHNPRKWIGYPYSWKSPEQNAADLAGYREDGTSLTVKRALYP